MRMMNTEEAVFSRESASACKKFIQMVVNVPSSRISFHEYSIWLHHTITVYLCLCSLLRISTELQWHPGVNYKRGQHLRNKKHSLSCVILIGYQHEDSWKKISLALAMVCGGQWNRFHNKIGFCEPWGIFISHKGDSKEAISLKYVDLIVSVMSVWIIRAILALMANVEVRGGSMKIGML